MSDYVTNFKIGPNGTPIYIRDSRLFNMPAFSIKPSILGLIHTKQAAQSVCKVNGKVYVLTNTAYDNMGTVRCYDVASNLLEYEKNIKVGHANSVAYNPLENAFYIAPMYNYTEGTAAGVNILYRYTDDFETLEEINTPIRCDMVAYDYQANKLYIANVFTIYEYTGESFNLVTNTLTIPQISNNGGTVNDFVVNNNTVYFSTTKGLVAMVDINSLELINVLHFDNVDASNTYAMGECQGIDIDEDGHMYGLFTYLDFGIYRSTAIGIYNATNAFIVQIPVDGYVLNNDLARFSQHSTYTVNSADADKLFPGANSLPALETVACLLDPTATVNVSGTVDCYRFVLINRSLAVNVQGGATLNFNDRVYLNTVRFGLFGLANSVINFNVSSNPMFDGNNRFNIITIGSLGTFGGDGVNLTNFYGAGYLKPIILLGGLPGFPNNKMKVNNTDLSANTAYVTTQQISN